MFPNSLLIFEHTYLEHLLCFGTMPENEVQSLCPVALKRNIIEEDKIHTAKCQIFLHELC